MRRLGKTSVSIGRMVFGVVAVCVFGTMANGAPWDGNGTAEDPYKIFDACDMQAIGADSNYWDAHFKLMNDIDLSAYTGTSFNIIGDSSNPFMGAFDGNNHTISNFTYSDVNQEDVGLFGFIKGPDARVENLCLNDPCIVVENGWRVGAIAGYLRQGTISGCRSQNGSVYGHFYIGGLVGAVGGLSTPSYDCVITDCHSIGDVQGNYCCGGLAGSMQRYSYLTNSHAEGHVQGISNIGGGLIGETNNAQSVKSCYYNGQVSGDDKIGGLIGRNYYTLTENCYAMGTVEGIGDEPGGAIGGLVGNNDSQGRIVYCYSTCQVSGDMNVGGLVGTNNGTVEHSYWDIQTSNQEISAGGIGKTTIEMKTGGTYFAWGCEPWTINQYIDYPHLIWENLPGQSIKEYIYGGGSGEPNDPYVILTAAHFRAIGFNACDWDKHFRLMADVDMSEFKASEAREIGGSFEPAFRGVFDGSYHTIKNFHFVDDPKVKYDTGIFGRVDDPNAEICNLGVIDPCIVGAGSSTGALVGSLNTGCIRNCFVFGGDISCDWEVGGLIGSIFYNAKVINCYSRTNVYGLFCVGGLIGHNSWYGEIINSYSQSQVYGEENVGGLLGDNYNVVNRCYSCSYLEGTNFVGGLIGYDYGGLYTKSFWDSDVNPDVNGIGNTTDPNVIGKSTTEMQTKSTFIDAGWDFVGESANGTDDIWDICEGTNYPKFVWQKRAADFVCPDGVNFIDYAFFAEHWLQTIYGDCSGVELTGDGKVNGVDFALFAEYWMLTSCGECGGADLTGDENVDMADLSVFATHWLETEYAEVDLTNDGQVGLDDLREFTENWLEGIGN